MKTPLFVNDELMGLYGSRFYFKEGLPKITAVQDKFKEITGLRLDFSSDLYLSELVDNQEDIVSLLNRPKDDSYISIPFFTCDGFDDARMAHYSVEEKSFQIEYGAGSSSLYFFYALMKTMYELGGLDFKHSVYPAEKDLIIEDHLAPYIPHDRFWKRIKKWEQMSEIEKKCFE